MTAIGSTVTARKPLGLDAKFTKEVSPGMPEVSRTALPMTASPRTKYLSDEGFASPRVSNIRPPAPSSAIPATLWVTVFPGIDGSGERNVIISPTAIFSGAVRFTISSVPVGSVGSMLPVATLKQLYPKKETYPLVRMPKSTAARTAVAATSMSADTIRPADRRRTSPSVPRGLIRGPRKFKIQNYVGVSVK